MLSGQPVVATATPWGLMRYNYEDVNMEDSQSGLLLSSLNIQKRTVSFGNEIQVINQISTGKQPIILTPVPGR